MSLFGPLSPPALPPPPLPSPNGPDKPQPGKPQPGPPPITWTLAIGLAGAVLGSLVSNLDTRLTTFSLADLRGGIGFGVDEASWVSTAYNVAEVAVVPMTPWLAAIVSPRRAIAAAAALLTIAGAFVPIAAPHFVALVAMRFLQGMGGGALIPLLLLSVLRFTPAHQRVYGLTVYGFVTTATPLFAEPLAGFLTEFVNWQSIFYICVPVGPLVALMVLFGMPVEPVKTELFAKTDYGGMALLAVFAGLLTAALGEGQRLDWFDSPLIDSLFAASALFLAAFVLLELTLKAPLIDLGLLRRFNFTGGLLMVFAFAFASLFTGSVVPMYGTAVRLFREPQVGAILVWGGAAQVAVALAVPFVLRRLEARVVIALGLFGSAIGCRLATFIDSDWVGADLLASVVLQSASQLLLLVPIVVVSTAVLQPKDALSGGTIFNVWRDLAISAAGAVVGGVLTVRERVHSFYLTDHAVAGAPATVLREAQGGLAALAGAIRTQATVQASADMFGWLGVAMLAAFALTFVLKQTPIPFPPK